MATILITGAGQRIGLDLAKHLVQQDYQLIISYRTKHSSIEQLEQLGVTCIQCDFSEQGAVNEFCEKVKAHTTELRAIIHNASSWDCEGKNPNFDSLFDNMMNIHAKVPYLINLALRAVAT